MHINRPMLKCVISVLFCKYTNYLSLSSMNTINEIKNLSGPCYSSYKEKLENETLLTISLLKNLMSPILKFSYVSKELMISYFILILQ